VAVTGIQTYTSNVTLSIDLNNLPNLSTAVSAAYDNTTTGYMTMEVQFSVTCNLSTTDYFAPTSRTPYIYLYLLKSVDGGVTYDDADINNAELLRIEWTRAANSNVAQQYFASVLVDSVPQFFKFMVYNFTGFHICIAHPHGIMSAPDGNLWACDSFEQRLWKITTAGAFDWYTTASDTTFGGGPSGTGNLGDITLGSDGNMWVPDFYNNRIWKITTAPVFTPYAPITSKPNGICFSANDFNFWICDNMGYVWRVTPAGVATSFLLSLGAPLTGICFQGADGNVWVSASDGFVWSVTTTGVATPYFIGGTLTGICDAFDGNSWASDSTGFVWKITTGGVGTSYALAGGTPTGICVSLSDFNLWLCDTAASGQVWQVTIVGVPTAFSLGAFALPTGICSGPDSNLWVSDSLGKVKKVTTAGVPTSYTLSAFFCSPTGICSGPDGNLWVSDSGGGSVAKVWKVTTGGVGTSYFTFTSPPAFNKAIIGDGINLWVADFKNHAIKVTTAGVVTPYNLIPFLNPYTASNGSDSNMWMCEFITDYIWKIDTTTGLPYWYLRLPGAGIYDICSGPDGNLWICGGIDGNVWKVTTAGVTTAYFLGGITYGIASGPDGNLWVANSDGNIWKVTTAGATTSYATGSFPRGICSHTDGNLWATGATDKVMKVTTAGAVTLYTLTGSNVNDTLNICSGPDGNLWVNDFSGKIWKVTTGGVGTSYTLIVDTVITVSGKYDTYT
jgi:virginiamycin B lyase